MRASRRALPNNDVQLVVFERRIQQLFENRLQAMNLINEENLLVLQVSDDGRQIAFDLQERCCRRLEVCAKLVSNDVGQRGLAQTRWPVQQHVIHGFATRPRRFNRHRQIFFDLGLSDEFAQPLRPQLQLERRVVFHRHGGHQPLPVVVQIRIIFCRGHWPDITTLYGWRLSPPSTYVGTEMVYS